MSYSGKLLKIFKAASALAGAVNSSPIRNVVIEEPVNNSINVTWSNSVPIKNGSPVLRYNIFRNGEFIGTSNTTSFQDTIQQPESSTRYSYSISAVYVDNSYSRPRSNSTIIKGSLTEKFAYSWGDGKFVGFDQDKKAGSRL